MTKLKMTQEMIQIYIFIYVHIYISYINIYIYIHNFKYRHIIHENIYYSSVKHDKAQDDTRRDS